MKQNYVPPEILEDVQLESDFQILQQSNVTVDENFEKVETMGQEIGETINSNDWSQEW